MEVPAKIVLDESQYGKGLHGAWRWSFFATKNRSKDKDEDDGGSFITVTSNKEPILTAVTKSQYKSWNKQGMIAIKRPIRSLWPDIIKRYIKKIFKWIYYSD
jgi:hypothetical protein